MRQMHLVGFLQAQNCTTLPASWRHPQSRTDTCSPDYYRHIAQVLESGRFDIGFYDDRLAMPDIYTGNHEHAVREGVRCVKLDPMMCLMTMAAATERLGLGATCSTTYYEPFHVARQFQTMDHMTRGRAAWNVVTSLNDSEAHNMGRDGVVEHDLRYDRADEFMEVVHGHWDSWEDDAVVCDKANNLYARPEKVHRLDYEGKYLKSRGPFTVPRGPQGTPVIIQAGQSGRGQRFAAAWGELIFVKYADVASGQRSYRTLKEAAAATGRDPDHMKIATLGYPVAAATRTEAEDRMAAYDRLSRETDHLALLSEILNFDFAVKGLDEPFTDEEIEGIQGVRAFRDRVIATGVKNPTVRDFLRISGRGLLSDFWVGGPKEIADTLEEWFVTRACDGFVIGATHQPGAFEDFVRFIVPELQRRGLYRRDYAGTTLRDHLGLPHPAVGAWRRAAEAAE